MYPHTPGARLPRWRTNLRGAWLIKINNTTVTTIADAQAVFNKLYHNNTNSCTLLFAHPKINRDISNNGLPIIHAGEFNQLTLGQLNNQNDLRMQHQSLSKELRHSRQRQYDIVSLGEVLNYSSKAMKLTRGRLLKLNKWHEWQQSEYPQLNQYEAQGMFGQPTQSNTDDAIFHLVWT